MQYFFLDLAHLLPEEENPGLVDSLIKFPSAFSLPPSLIKLTQVQHYDMCIMFTILYLNVNTGILVAGP